MASIDYQEARKEVEKIFRAESGRRKIVFWYDAPANFKEDIVVDSFDFCRLLVCENNEFYIKKIIERDDLESNILVYIPAEKPADKDNWLLDILLYSEEYYADTVALTMRHLGLSNPDLRKVIEKHTKFFDSVQRIKKLENYIDINDQMSSRNFMLAMMCVLVKASVRTVEAIVTELVFDNVEQTKYKEIVKYGFEELLWNLIGEEYGYSGNQKLDLFVKKCLFTSMLEQGTHFKQLPSFYMQFVVDGEEKNGARSFVHHIKQDPRYSVLQLSTATDLKIEGLLSTSELQGFGAVDTFECIDNAIIKRISESLQSGSLEYDTFDKILIERKNSMWFENHMNEYMFLQATISFLRKIDKPIIHDLTAEEYIKLYVENYYQIDAYYRHACESVERIENPISEIEGLARRVEYIYEQRYLDVIGGEYSKALQKHGEWSFAGIRKSYEFYQYIQREQYKKLFVIISDGMRYEIGQELYDTIKSDAKLRGEVTLDYAMSSLPSETRFGMAALLPHETTTYNNGNVLVNGMPTNSLAARNEILQKKNSSYSAISYETINRFSRDELREYMADKSLVYIYHNVIDNAGEHDESRLFSEIPKAVRELSTLVKRLYNHLQISNFFITADHGFLYRQNQIYESQKYGNVVSQKPLEASKRYVICGDNEVDIPYSSSFALDNLTNDDLHVVVPFSYDLFKTQGAGIQYVHGGASLQETIVPIIHVSGLNENKGKKLSRPVGVRLKSVVRKITNRSFSLDFEQYEKVEDKVQPIRCETYFVDEDGNKVSGVYRFVANSTSNDAETRVTKIRFVLNNTEFDRNKRYYLILRDMENASEYIEREQFIIDILGFRTF